jgi:N-methylhydantoinase B
MEGGRPGTLNCILVRREGKTLHRIRKIVACKLQENDVVSIRTGAGGGWGEPLDRDSALVIEDVRAGLISAQEAGSIYGVVFDPEKLEVDEAATIALRERLRQKSSKAGD